MAAGDLGLALSYFLLGPEFCHTFLHCCHHSHTGSSYSQLPDIQGKTDHTVFHSTHELDICGHLLLITPLRV